jgi:hypothetical protein
VVVGYHEAIEGDPDHYAYDDFVWHHLLELKACSACRGNLTHSTARSRSDEIVVGLKVQPELRGRSERAREQPRRFRSNPALAAHEFVDPLDRYSKVLGQRDLSNAERLEKLLAQDLPWVGRYSVPWKHHNPLVVIDNLDVMRITVLPPKDDPPSIIDPDAVLAAPFSLECLESVPGWRS